VHIGIKICEAGYLRLGYANLWGDFCTPAAPLQSAQN